MSRSDWFLWVGIGFFGVLLLWLAAGIIVDWWDDWRGGGGC